jgi:hypothetical protein
MKAEKMKRKAQKIHLGDGKYLDARTIHMKWYGAARSEDDDDLLDDDLETLAKLQFKVKAHEYAVMARLGLVDTDAEAEAEESERESKITLRTDRDLVDEGEEALEEEWNTSLDDPTCPLSVWADLDYWEVESVN